MVDKISVIVPIYNAEKTLADCLGNLVNQTYSTMEIILVDDASMDHSYQICQDCKEQFADRVVILQQKKNAGPGAARNLGLSVATGTYVGYVDADDVVDLRMFELLYSRIVETGSDFVDCAFYRESQEKALLHVTQELCGTLDARKRSILIASGGFCVTKLFSRQFLLDHHLLFREEYSLEDMDYLMNCIMCADKVFGIEDILYMYKDRNDSLSKEFDVDKYCRNHMKTMTAIYEGLSVKKNYVDVQEASEYAIISLYMNIINRCIFSKKHNRDPHMLSILKEARSIRQHCVTGDILKNHFAQDKISAINLKLIQLNDLDPKKALAL